MGVLRGREHPGQDVARRQEGGLRRQPRGLEEGASLPPAQQPRRRHRGLRHRGVRARGGRRRRGGAGRAPGAPRPQRRQPCITAPGLGRGGSDNICLTRRDGLLINRAEGTVTATLLGARTRYRPLATTTAPAADRHDHLVDVPLRTRARAAGPQPARPPRPCGRGVGPGRRFGYIGKVHRFERCASRQLYCPMRARSPCRQIAPSMRRCRGGIERIVAHLSNALVELGHQVTLFASADADTRAMVGVPGAVHRGRNGAQLPAPLLAALRSSCYR